MNDLSNDHGLCQFATYAEICYGQLNLSLRKFYVDS